MASKLTLTNEGVIATLWLMSAATGRVPKRGQ